MIHIHLAPKIDDMIERNSVNITLHDVDPTALHSLVEYTYTGEITITEDNVQVKEKFTQTMCVMTLAKDASHHIFWHTIK